MSYINPSPTDFQNYFVRDFPYGVDVTTSVTTTDITNAMQDASYNIQPAFFPDQTSYNAGFLQLSAHYLVLALRAGSQGIQGQWNWLESGKGVAGASQSFAIPPRILEDPMYSWLTKTNYGMKYLSYVLPYMNGVMGSVQGFTHP